MEKENLRPHPCAKASPAVRRDREKLSVFLATVISVDQNVQTASRSLFSLWKRVIIPCGLKTRQEAVSRTAISSAVQFPNTPPPKKRTQEFHRHSGGSPPKVEACCHAPPPALSLLIVVRDGSVAWDKLVYRC